MNMYRITLVNLFSMNIFSNYHLPFDFFMTVFRCKSIFMHETCQIFLCNAIFFFLFIESLPILRLDKYSHGYIF